MIKIALILAAIVGIILLIHSNQSLRTDLATAQEQFRSCSNDLTATNLTLKATIEKHNAEIDGPITASHLNDIEADRLKAESIRLKGLANRSPTIPRLSDPSARLSAIEAAIDEHRRALRPL